MSNNNPAHPNPVVIGVDVGSGSVRAGVFAPSGTMLGRATQPITLYKGPEHYVEQSSREIWDAVCQTVRQAVAASKVSPDRVAGIGFDATCSLVVVGDGGVPLAVGPSEDPQRNVIVWMDHRATAQAEAINATEHPVLQYVGGKISPEMETPKLLWLKENRPDVYHNAWQFFDLADFLTWKASGDLARSVCTVTCKWTYLAHEKRWDPDYFQQIGLEELADEDFRRIGVSIIEPGMACGKGLTTEAADRMGLPLGTPVAAGMIDAHAGGIGTVGVGGGAVRNLAYVFGTSSCTMTSTQEPAFIPGVWGPYYSAMVPGLWLNEGGQSAAGAAIAQLVSFHPAAPEATFKAKDAGLSLPSYLASLAQKKGLSSADAIQLARDIHVVPEFLGNRSPHADPHARAVIVGLGMESDIDSLLSLYIAGLCGIGYGLRQIIDAQVSMGVTVDNVVLSGGAGRHSLVRQLIADACGYPIMTTKADEPVLLGAAILGAVAGGISPSVSHAMEQFCVPDSQHLPEASVSEVHTLRYQAYVRLQNEARLIRETLQ
ncbi:FGGY-family carbohydrate kinase [Rouxiella silvae]|uniref:FGGY-family carbohydrate kinase n=1 Tax=Rouxiella silvae TaxID=1646373 RepID=A0AA40X1C3_9GAMM|nr:FGGY-family carbohydrate kinase [Rouxiella silvae]MBF6636624.1 FGGY-family carbohydrate kinase [Rouxiella silvae]